MFFHSNYVRCSLWKKMFFSLPLYNSLSPVTSSLFPLAIQTRRPNMRTCIVFLLHYSCFPLWKRFTPFCIYVSECWGVLSVFRLPSSSIYSSSILLLQLHLFYNPSPPPCPSFLLICIDVHTKRSLVFKRKGLEVLKLSKSSGILSLSTQLSSVFLLLRFVLIFLHNVRENPQKVSNLVKWFLSSLSNTCIAAVFNLPRKKFFICSFFFFLRLIRQRENTKL